MFQSTSLFTLAVHTHITVHKVAGPNEGTAATFAEGKREKSVDVRNSATRTLVGMMPPLEMGSRYKQEVISTRANTWTGLTRVVEEDL